MSPFRVLKNNNYRLYFLGQVFSMSGTWMQTVAQSWLVYRLTGSGAWLGVLGFATHMTAFLVSPIAGVVADQADRRKVFMIVSVLALIQAFTLGGLVLMGHVELWYLMVMAMILGLLQGFEITTRHAFAIDLVGKADLPNAIVLNSIVINVSRVVGPALAGFLIGLVGEAWCFILNGISYLPVLAGLMFMRLQNHRPQRPKATILGHLIEGKNYVRGEPLIKRLLVISACVCFIASPVVVLLPVFAKAVLGGGADTLAWLTSAMGIGAVTGALFLSRGRTTATIRKQLVKYILFWGGGLVVLGYSQDMLLSLIAMFAIGYFMMSVFPTLNNAIQQMVDDSMRGRVMALYTMTFLGTLPFGSLILGWASDHYGARNVAILAGCLTAMIALAIIPNAFWEPRKKRISSPQAS